MIAYDQALGQRVAGSLRVDLRLLQRGLRFGNAFAVGDGLLQLQFLQEDLVGVFTVVRG